MSRRILQLAVFAALAMAAFGAAACVPTSPVPEPATFWLLGGGIGGVLLLRRLRARK